MVWSEYNYIEEKLHIVELEIFWRCNFLELNLIFTLEICWFSAKMLWDSSPGRYVVFLLKIFKK